MYKRQEEKGKKRVIIQKKTTANSGARIGSQNYPQLSFCKSQCHDVEMDNVSNEAHMCWKCYNQFLKSFLKRKENIHFPLRNQNDIKKENCM